MANITRRMARAAFKMMPTGRRVLEELISLRSERATLQQQMRQSAEEQETAETRLAALTEENTEIKDQMAHLSDLMASYGEPPWVPNGHFYSPIHSIGEVQQDLDRIYPPLPRELPGINLRESEQLRLLEQLLPFFADFDFTPSPSNGRRYGFHNNAYTYGDSVFLNAMIRHVRPGRLIEIGSGHSSCMTLDTNDLWFDGSISCTFIEPYPQLLHSLLKPGDFDRIKILPKRVQDVDLALFKTLRSNDILFIDSTHVSKIGSDVNRIYFEILPSLAEGVYIHIHDIFYPFEYPKSWVLGDRRAWNEQYVLRALLLESNAYDILLFNTFMTHFYPEFFAENLAAALKDRGGSIWLRKNG